MSLTPRPLFRRARDRHPALNDRSTPDSVLLDRLSTLQNELLTRGSVLRPGWLQQKMTVALALDAENAPGTVGIGVGGLPAMDDDGIIAAVEAGAGGLAFIDIEQDADFRGVPSVLGTDDATFAGQTWDVNEWEDAYLVVVDGPGLGGTRRIVSNTADTLQLDSAYGWPAEQPSAISVFGIFATEPEVDQRQGVVTQLPSLKSRRGYLVKLDAEGSPYLDTETPVLHDVTAGVPLPQNIGVGSQGSVFFLDNTAAVPLSVVNAAQRYALSTRYGAVLDGDTLVLAGTLGDWTGVKNIEIPYTPVLPSLTTLDDVLLLPDAIEPVLVGHLAAFTARRLIGRGTTREDWELLQAEAEQADAAFMATLAGAGRARKRVVREVW